MGYATPCAWAILKHYLVVLLNVLANFSPLYFIRWGILGGISSTASSTWIPKYPDLADFPGIAGASVHICALR